MEGSMMEEQPRGQLPDETRNLGVATSTAREIRNVGMLDLSGLDAPEALDGVVAIRNVGVIIVPEPLLPRLSRIPMRNVGSTIPVPAGARPRIFSGDTILSGDALANADGNANDVLIVSGTLVVTSPVAKVGYSQFIASGEVIAPEGSEAALGSGLTRMSGDLFYYPYAAGASVRVRVGAQEVSGRDLANPSGQETDILLVVGAMSVTGPVERLGYQQVVVVGTMVLPPGSEDVLAGRVSSLGGRVIYSTARLRQFTGNDSFGRGFFEYLDEPILLAVTGNCTLEDDVTPDLLKEKVAGIILTGNFIAPRAALGAVQALTLSKTGNISASDDPRVLERARERERERARDRGRDGGDRA
jgi:hypothetical protein